MISAFSRVQVGGVFWEYLLGLFRVDAGSGQRQARKRTAGLTAHSAIAAVSLALLAFGLIGAASAAEVVVKGQDLQGSVVGVSSEGVEFETIYGKGTIVIPWSDVQRIQSDKEFMILHGDDDETIGRIWGLEGAELLVGDSLASAGRIPVDRILRSITREQAEKSRLEAWRARYRYWKASFDIGFAYTDATTDSTQFSTGLELRRRKKPTDFLFSAYYLYGTTKEKGEQRTLNQNVAFGRSRFDYDLRERLFAFASITGEYNEVQSLSIRTDPTVGLGYRFVDRENLTISGRSGPGYVYQRYFDGDTDDYFTILFGGDLEADLPYDSRLRISAEYLPSVSDWQQSYVIRGTADWTMPILGWLDFKLSILETYNNQPAPDTQRNSLTTLAGLSMTF